jgi:DNA-binding HxlR family transcriptional regulator
MKRQSFSDMECPIAQALEQIGEGWSLLVLREAMLGFRFFGDFERRLGITPTTLTRRLTSLIDNGLLERRRKDDHPPRDEYVLTDKGTELVGLFVWIGSWSNKWIAGAGHEYLQFVDRDTGVPVEAELIDKKTLKIIRPTSVRLAAGPGASPELKRQMSLRRPGNGV